MRATSSGNLGSGCAASKRAGQATGNAAIGWPPATVWVPACAASAYLWLVFATTVPFPGAIGLNYNTLGTDWMVFDGAIGAVLAGDATLIYDGDRFTDLLDKRFAAWLSQPLPFRPWTYPPSFLLLLAPFAGLGFPASYVAFQLVTAALMIAALRLIARDGDACRLLMTMALACPAAAINVIDGQVAFLVIALTVGGIAWLDARPVAAGLILGLLTFKPQFCILVPLALIAAGAWRALAAAALSAVTLAVASAWTFGWQLWADWLPLIVGHLLNPDAKWIAYGRMWGHSVHTCAVLLGAPAGLATAVQLLAACGSAAAVVAAFRSPLRAGGRTGVLLAAMVLAAPHSGPYDAIALTVAAGLWLADRAAPPLWCWTLAFLVWLVPLLSPPLLVAAGRLSPLLVAVLITCLLRSGAARPPMSRPLPAMVG